jgi:hypothetical protein
MIFDQPPPSERARPAGRPLVRVDERFVEQLAERVAGQVASRLRQRTGPKEGYLNAEAAGRYIGARRKRIHDLTSMGRLVPDGHDGRQAALLPPLARRLRTGRRDAPVTMARSRLGNGGPSTRRSRIEASVAARYRLPTTSTGRRRYERPAPRLTRGDS